MDTNEIKLTAESAAAYNAMFAPSAEVPTLPWDSEPKTEEELTALGITFESEEREQEAQMAFIDEYESGNDDPQLSKIITTYNF